MCFVAVPSRGGAGEEWATGHVAAEEGGRGRV